MEKPEPNEAPSNIATHGGYILPPEIFSALKRIKPGRSGEIWLVDAINLLKKEGVPVYTVVIENGRYYDTGNKFEYLKTVIEFALTHEEINGDFRAFLEANSRFHNAWRALIPNRRMSKLLDQYVGHVRFLRVLTLGDASARKTALTGMKNIHAAFKKRDADAAAAAMHKHLEAAKHFLITAIEQIDQEKEAEQRASGR